MNMMESLRNQKRTEHRQERNNFIQNMQQNQAFLMSDRHQQSRLDALCGINGCSVDSDHEHHDDHIHYLSQTQGVDGTASMQNAGGSGGRSGIQRAVDIGKKVLDTGRAVAPVVKNIGKEVATSEAEMAPVEVATGAETAGTALIPEQAIAITKGVLKGLIKSPVQTGEAIRKVKKIWFKPHPPKGTTSSRIEALTAELREARTKTASVPVPVDVINNFFGD